MEIIIGLVALVYLYGWYAYIMDEFKTTSTKNACFLVLVIPLILGGGYLFFLESGNFWYYGAILLMATFTLMCKGVARTIFNILYFLGMAALIPLGFIEGTKTYYMSTDITYGWFYFDVYSIRDEMVWNNGVGTVVGQNTYFDWLAALIVVATIALFFVVPFVLWVKRGAESRRARKNHRAQVIYEKIASAGITDLADPARQRDVALIKKHFGIKKTAALRKKYELGKRLIQTEEQEAEEQVRREAQEQVRREEQKQQEKVLAEQKSYEEEKARTAIRGKEKYLRPLRTAYNAAVKYHEQLMDMSGEDFFMKKKSDNWGWAGGLASGIAGPVAGVVAAVEAHERNMAHNAAAEAHNRAMVEAGLTTWDIDKKIEEERSFAADTKTILAHEWDDIENKVLDDADAEGLMAYLQFEVTGKVMPQKNLELQVSIRLTEQPRLLGNPAVLDGSVRIDVLNEQGRPVGEAYCNAPGFDTWELDKVGFANLQCKTVAVPVGGKAFEAGANYTYRVSPVALWLMEQ